MHYYLKDKQYLKKKYWLFIFYLSLPLLIPIQERVLLLDFNGLWWYSFLFLEIPIFPAFSN